MPGQGLFRSQNHRRQRLCRAAGRWHVGSIITGQTSVEQLKEYLPAVTDIELDEETLDEVDQIHMEDRNPHWTD